MSNAPEVLVRDLMSADVVTVLPNTDLGSANAVMKLKRLRHLPVVEQDKLVGLITHRDIVYAHVSSTVELTARETATLTGRIHAKDIMRKEVQTVTPETTVVDAGRLMLDKKFGCLPVVERGKLVGIITEADLLRFLINVLDHTAAQPSSAP